MDKQRKVILGAGLVACATVFFQVAGYAATQTSDNADSASSELSVTLSRSIEAGKRVSDRALSSKAKEMNAKAIPVATGTSATAGKAATATASVTDKTTDTGVGAVAAEGAQNVQKKLSSGEGAKVSPAEPPKKYVFEYPDQPVIDEKMEPVKKKIEGEVGVVIKMGMGVEFDRNNKAASSSDLWINFAKGVKLEGVKSFGDFRDGDKVRVSYTESKDGSKRVIESIKLLKAKTDEERKKEALAVEAAVLAEEKASKNISLEGES